MIRATIVKRVVADEINWPHLEPSVSTLLEKTNKEFSNAQKNLSSNFVFDKLLALRGETRTKISCADIAGGLSLNHLNFIK